MSIRIFYTVLFFLLRSFAYSQIDVVRSESHTFYSDTIEKSNRLMITFNSNFDYNYLEIEKLNPSYRTTISLNLNSFNNENESIEILLRKLMLFSNVSEFELICHFMPKSKNLFSLFSQLQINTLDINIDYIPENIQGSNLEAIFENENIKALYVFAKSFIAIPDATSRLQNLKELGIYCDSIISITDSIQYLPSLSTLYIKNYVGRELSYSIFNGKSLNRVVIILDEKCIFKSTTSILNTSHINELSITYFDLTIPDYCPFSSLKHLAIYIDTLSSLPEIVFCSDSLTAIYLYYNYLDWMPNQNEIEHLKNVKYFLITPIENIHRETEVTKKLKSQLSKDLPNLNIQVYSN